MSIPGDTPRQCESYAWQNVVAAVADLCDAHPESPRSEMLRRKVAHAKSLWWDWVREVDQ
jgi:hypothetical protein